MKNISRTIYASLLNTLTAEGKMVLVSGPRQSGKTTFSRQTAENFKNSVYFNWDTFSDRKLFAADPLFFTKLNRADESKPLIILDEIHKYRKWKNYLKGIYDEYGKDYQFMVTGSGRMDIGSKGGEALTGRYFHMNVFPLTIAELAGHNRKFDQFNASPIKHFDSANGHNTHKLWNSLMKYSGFPEPFLKADDAFYRRWSNDYARNIIREDIRTTFELKNVDSLELLFSLMPSKVGSPFSISSTAENLQVSYDTVKNWTRLLDAFYVTFTIPTWTKKVARSIRKEKKTYLFNYAEIDDMGARFENAVALELWRAVNNWTQAGLGRFGLSFLKTKDGAEVDFIITQADKPFLLVETKLSDDNISKAMMMFQNRLMVPAVQLVNHDNVLRQFKNGQQEVLVVSAHRWLSTLP